MFLLFFKPNEMLQPSAITDREFSFPSTLNYLIPSHEERMLLGSLIFLRHLPRMPNRRDVLLFKQSLQGGTVTSNRYVLWSAVLAFLRLLSLRSCVRFPRERATSVVTGLSFCFSVSLKTSRISDLLGYTRVVLAAFAYVQN